MEKLSDAVQVEVPGSVSSHAAQDSMVQTGGLLKEMFPSFSRLHNCGWWHGSLIAGRCSRFLHECQASPMRRMQFFMVKVLVPFVIFALSCSQSTWACTTAVISGKVTHDGRPILWKNRDTSYRHNELVLLDSGQYRALAVVNAGSRKSVWMGTNEAGFCIENSLSKDLSDESEGDQ